MLRSIIDDIDEDELKREIIKVLDSYQGPKYLVYQEMGFMDCRGIKTNIDNTFATGMYYQDKLCSCQAFDCFMKYWNSPDFKSRMKQFKNYSPSVFNELVGISETWKERYKVAENPKLKEFNNVIRRTI